MANYPSREPAIGDKTKRMLSQFIMELRQNVNHSESEMHPLYIEETKDVIDPFSTERRIQDLWDNLKKRMLDTSDTPSNKPDTLGQ